MKVTKPFYQRSKFNSYESLTLNYIVFEKNDDGLLLECDVVKNNTSYSTTICIDFKELNRLMGVINHQTGFDVYSLISEHIISSDNAICELNFQKELGSPIELFNYAFQSTHHLLRA